MLVGLNVICIPESTNPFQGYIDPVDLDSGGLTETENEYIIKRSGSYYEYVFQKKEVVHIEQYSICQSCEWSKNKGSRYGCQSCIEAEQETNEAQADEKTKSILC